MIPGPYVPACFYVSNEMWIYGLTTPAGGRLHRYSSTTFLSTHTSTDSRPFVSTGRGSSKLHHTTRPTDTKKYYIILLDLTWFCRPTRPPTYDNCDIDFHLWTGLHSFAHLERCCKAHMERVGHIFFTHSEDARSVQILNLLELQHNFARSIACDTFDLARDLERVFLRWLL